MQRKSDICGGLTTINADKAKGDDILNKSMIKTADDRFNEVKEGLRHKFESGMTISSLEDLEQYAHAWFNYGFDLGRSIEERGPNN